MHATEHPRPDPDGWRDLAACRDMDPAAFFPGQFERADTAIAACRRCPVQDRCLTDALELERSVGLYAVFGVRGGLHAHERKDIIIAGRRRAS